MEYLMVGKDLLSAADNWEFVHNVMLKDYNLQCIKILREQW